MTTTMKILLLSLTVGLMAVIWARLNAVRGDYELAGRVFEHFDRLSAIEKRLRARGKFIQANRIEGALKRLMDVDEFLTKVESVIERCSKRHPKMALNLSKAYGVPKRTRNDL